MINNIKFGQSRLNAHGATLKVDGKLGPKTKSAIQEFQNKHGLPLTNSFDYLTRAMLGRSNPEHYVWGLDISRWQGKIDYSKLPISCKFIIAKLSEGATHNHNLIVPSSENYRVGYYHFARPDNNLPQKEVEAVQDRLPLDCRFFALDFEVGKTPIGYDKVTWCNEFNARFYSLRGFYPVLYTYSNNLKAKGYITEGGLWVSDYNGLYHPRSHTYSWDMWQCANDGVIEGVPNKVDLNICSTTFLNNL